MFNFNFWELMIIAVVALVVIGPERLPKVARKAGYWLGRMQRFMNSLAEDINKEMEIEKLKEMQFKAQQQLLELDDKIQRESAETNNVFAEAEYKVNTMGLAKKAEEDEDWEPADKSEQQTTVEVLQEEIVDTKPRNKEFVSTKRKAADDEKFLNHQDAKEDRTLLN